MLESPSILRSRWAQNVPSTSTHRIAQPPSSGRPCAAYHGRGGANRSVYSSLSLRLGSRRFCNIIELPRNRRIDSRRRRDGHRVARLRLFRLQKRQASCRRNLGTSGKIEFPFRSTSQPGNLGRVAAASRSRQNEVGASRTFGSRFPAWNWISVENQQGIRGG